MILTNTRESRSKLQLGRGPPQAQKNRNKKAFIWCASYLLKTLSSFNKSGEPMLFFYWKTCDFYVVMTKIRFMSMLYLVYRHHPVYMGDVAQW